RVEHDDVIATTEAALDPHPRLGIVVCDALQAPGSSQLEQLVDAAEQLAVNRDLRHRPHPAEAAGERRYRLFVVGHLVSVEHRLCLRAGWTARPVHGHSNDPRGVVKSSTIGCVYMHRMVE